MPQVHQGVLNKEEKSLLIRMDELSFMPMVPFHLARWMYIRMEEHEKIMRSIHCCDPLDVLKMIVYRMGWVRMVTNGNILQTVFSFVRTF